MEAYNWYQFIAAGSKYSKNSPYFNLKNKKTFPLNKEEHAFSAIENTNELVLTASLEKYIQKSKQPIYIAFPHIIYAFKDQINVAPLLWIPVHLKEGKLYFDWEERIVNYPLLLFLETYFEVHGALITSILSKPLDELLFEVSRYTQSELTQHLFKGLLTSIPNDLKSDTYYQLNLERRSFLIELNAQLVSLEMESQYLHFPHFKDIPSSHCKKLYHHLQFKDLKKDEILTQICSGQNLFVQGAAGTGKTTLISQLAQYFSHQEIPVSIVVPNTFLKLKLEKLLERPLDTLSLRDLQKIQQLYQQLEEDEVLIHQFDGQHQATIPYYHFSSAYLIFLWNLKASGHDTPFKAAKPIDQDFQTYLNKGKLVQWWSYFRLKRKHGIKWRRKQFHRKLKEEGLALMNLRWIAQDWQKFPQIMFLDDINYPKLHASALVQSFKLMQENDCDFEDFLKDQSYYYIKNQYPNISKKWSLVPSEEKASIRVLDKSSFKTQTFQEQELILIDEANSMACHEIFPAFEHQVIAFADPMQYLQGAQQHLIQQIQGQSSPDLLAWMEHEDWKTITLDENYRWTQKLAEIAYVYCPKAEDQLSKVKELIQEHPDAWLVCLRKEDQEILSTLFQGIPVHHISTILGLECQYLIFISHYEVQEDAPGQNFSLLSKKNKEALYHILSTRAREKAYILHSIDLDAIKEDDAFFTEKIRSKAQLDIGLKTRENQSFKGNRYRILLNQLKQELNFTRN